jgi:hypothetical protein
MAAFIAYQCTYDDDADDGVWCEPAERPAVTGVHAKAKQKVKQASQNGAGRKSVSRDLGCCAFFCLLPEIAQLAALPPKPTAKKGCVSCCLRLAVILRLPACALHAACKSFCCWAKPLARPKEAAGSLADWMSKM